MGTWGKGLYDDDYASDIRNEYIHALELKKDNYEITKEMIDAYDNDEDLYEQVLFWIVLADTQWNYGCLLPEVKEKALSYISNQNLMSEWASECEGLSEYRLEEINGISKKIVSKMPEPITVKKSKLFKCSWKIGDVFRYTLSEGYDKMSIYFVKCGEGIWHPGHICPEIYVFRGIYSSKLSINDVSKIKIIPQFYAPSAYKKDNFSEGILCRLLMLNTSNRIVPRRKIEMIGNKKLNSRLIEYEEKDSSGVCNYPMKWKDFDKYLINNWNKWKDEFNMIDEKFNLSAF